MPDFVVNTGPVIALTAAAGSLEFLSHLYSEILMPREVFDELAIYGPKCDELQALESCSVVRVLPSAIEIPLFLRRQLDPGEASVIQNALEHQVPTVAIDEKVGRRIARLHDLKVTGSLGILVRAVRQELLPDLAVCFKEMEHKGIWISESLKRQALHAVSRN